MKINLLGICLLITLFSNAQFKDYKVVFDLTTSDSVAQKNLTRWINEIFKGDPDAKLEVVLYGQSIDLVVKSRSSIPDVITKLLPNKNLSFRVCAIAMKAHNLNPGDFFPGVETVPDGIYEIITKQREGWGYIKVAR